MSARKEFGDFQTPDELATRVVALVSDIFGKPDVVVEPTAGLGSFLKASVQYSGKITNDRTATTYTDLDLDSDSRVFGFIYGDLVSDMDTYRQHQNLDGGSFAYTWRSGIKHDAAKIMELSLDGERLRNGFGESVELEDEFVSPLLKSSDLGNGRIDVRKYVLVTQFHTGDDTSIVKTEAPSTWDYLVRHGDMLDDRRSPIYKNRPRFSVFGIGSYSFAPWKVAISGFYKSFSFVVVPPAEGRPVMVDDTCYSIPCQSEEEARFSYELLSSRPALEFLRSLVFMDSKRPVTIDVLRRISFFELAREMGRQHELESHVHAARVHGEPERQMSLLMEPKQKYRIRQRDQYATVRD